MRVLALQVDGELAWIRAFIKLEDLRLTISRQSNRQLEKRLIFLTLCDLMLINAIGVCVDATQVVDWLQVTLADARLFLVEHLAVACGS